MYEAVFGSVERFFMIVQHGWGIRPRQAFKLICGQGAKVRFQMRVFNLCDNSHSDRFDHGVLTLVWTRGRSQFLIGNL